MSLLGTIGKKSLGFTGDLLSNLTPLAESFRPITLAKATKTQLPRLHIPNINASQLINNSVLKLSSRKETSMNLKQKLISKMRKTATPKISAKDYLINRIKIARVMQQRQITPFGTLKIAGPISSVIDAVSENPSKVLAGLALGTTAVGIGSELGGLAYSKYKQHRAYKQMFEEFPEFKDVPREQIDKYWQVLKDFAPSHVENPLVAGQFISNMMQYNMRGVDHAVVGTLAKSHADVMKGRSAAKAPVTTGAAQTALKAVVGSNAPMGYMAPQNPLASKFQEMALNHNIGVLNGDQNQFDENNPLYGQIINPGRM